MSKQSKSVQSGKKLTVPEIITYCKETLGITFKIKSEDEAKVFIAKYMVVGLNAIV